MFIDRVVLQLIAGKGGNGIVAWRREKYIPKGGPCGGDGGHGGSLVLKANPQIFALEGLRHRTIYRAENGGIGGPNCRRGKNGRDLILQVPCGTLVKDAETGEVLYDLTEPEQTLLLCRGGRGGRGNTHFKSPTNQAPTIATLGREGEIRDVELELKMIADVGLVGLPNAGKSTLMERLTHVHCKIAPYPFTTLRPNLGYIHLDERIYIADIPGIIAGAHRNRGLGLAFLRHIERTRLLLFLLDASGFEGRDPWEDFQVLRHELGAYREELLEKPFFILLNKSDMEGAAEQIAAFQARSSHPSFVLSAREGEGLEEVKEALRAFFNAQKQEVSEGSDEGDCRSDRPVELVGHSGS